MRRTLIGIALAALILTGCENEPEAECNTDPVELDSGLVYENIECGDGEEASTGLLVTVHYVLRLESGDELDSSRDRGEPFQFLLGGRRVIEGWEQGIPGMREGGRRRLEIPPDLAYGEEGDPPDIPPDATLIYEIELLEVGANPQN